MTMTKDEIINRIVDRFLQWKLPEDFRPDCGIEFDRDKYVRLNPLNRPFKPVGTNLLTATQATAMVKAIVGPEIEALRASQARVGRLEAALTPSAATKAAYIGEFQFPFSITGHAGSAGGDDIDFTPNVPWTTIKEIMAAIRAQALKETSDDA